jgi:hypothetical protein
MKLILVLPTETPGLRLNFIERLIMDVSPDSFVIEVRPGLLVINAVIPRHRVLLSLTPTLGNGPEHQAPQTAEAGGAFVLLTFLRVQVHVHHVVRYWPEALAA